MTKREREERRRMFTALTSLGFTEAECFRLRRISMTLRRWHELECGTGDDRVSRSIERENDEPDSKPYLRVQYATANGWQDKRYPTADLEKGAKKRLAKIIAARNARRTDQVQAYIQGDPRGAALYILRPGDVPEGEDAGAFYYRGICVY